VLGSDEWQVARRGRGKAEKAQRKHGGAMFGEGKWQFRRILKPAEVVTVCDHLGFTCQGTSGEDACDGDPARR